MAETKTVGELISMLQQLNPAARVWINDSEWGLLKLNEVRGVVLRDRPFLGSTIRAGGNPATATDLDVVVAG